MTAADKILQKALVASNIDSKEWNSVQAGLRDRAFFSSQVEEIRIIDAMRRNVSDLVSSNKSPSEIRRDIRQYLSSIGYDPDKNINPGEKSRVGTIKDLRTKSRLDVMMKTNADQAKGYVSHLRATTEGAIMAFPGYELVRVQQRKAKRDWKSRWDKAAREVGFDGVAKNGSMIALKTSPIWSALSVFGNPFPPFDFNSGMGVRDVNKSTCREIGLLGKEEQPEVPKQIDFNEHLSASLPAGHWSSDYQTFLHEKFGDQLRYDQDQSTGIVSVSWKRCILHDMFDRPDEYKNAKGWKLGVSTGKLLSACDAVDSRLKELISGKGLSIDDSIVRHTIKEGHWLVDRHKGNMPVRHGDIDLVPELWRNPDYVERGKDGQSLVLCIETVDGGILKMPIIVKGNTPVGTGLYKKAKPA